jgi:putative alpha-1,2-mannosidase
MMKTKILLFYLLTILPFPVCAQSAALADEVNMFMGVRGGSNCVIGPQLPHGSVNPAPQTPKGGQNGYDEHDVIRGFGQLHVSGIG